MKNLMKTPKKIFYFVWMCCLALLYSCETEPIPGQNGINEANLGVRAHKNVVNVTTTHMDLEMQSSIPSGWTTFQYENNSHNTHFFIIDKLPGDKTVEDSKAEVVPAFQNGMDYIGKGEWDKALAAFGELPDWYGKLIYTGGAGLLSPNRATQATVYLEPGNYVIECYVKNSEGVFHVTKVFLM